MTEKINSLEVLISEMAREESLAVQPSRRRFFVNALACGVAGVASPVWSQSAISATEQAEATPVANKSRLTINEGGHGPSRIHPSFVKDVGLMTNLNAVTSGCKLTQAAV